MKIRHTILLLVVLANTFTVFARKAPIAPSPGYKDIIFTESIDNDIFKASVADLQFYLEKATTQKYSLQPYTGKKASGIYILLARPGMLSSAEQDKLLKAGTEAFYIKANDQSLEIIASHPLGLSRGIYTYLDGLGIKWYFPGDKWTYIPSLKNITGNQVSFSAPSFALRDFFGTGGLFPMSSIDKAGIVKKDWDDWKRRNRMGGSVQLAGHYWEAFTIQHKTELIQHPEYLAEINGKRVSWNPSDKFCLSNKGLQDLFVADRIDYLRKQLALSPDSREKIILPVDPSDGGGHCTCAVCTKMGTVSDRVFNLANLVARAAAKVSPRACVNLYAYNEHAAPPSIKLEPNIMVQIIPYAFQDIGSPQEMISLWKKKTDQLFLYDYYGIPDWHFDAPLTGKWSPSALADKIHYWKAQNIQGFLLESSYSIGCTGPGLYLMSRIGWNINENLEAEQHKFYNLMFGRSAPAIEKYYDKISSNFREIADVPYLYSQLDQAVAAEGNRNDILNRIDLLKAYVHYATLFFQYKNSKNQLTDGTWENLMKYTWQMYPTEMVHATRIGQLLLVAAASNQKLVDYWNLYTQKSTGILNAKWITPPDIAGYEAADKEQYRLLPDFGYERGQYNYQFAVKPGFKGKDKQLLLKDFPDLFIRTSEKGEFKFSIKTTKPTDSKLTNKVKMILLDTATGSRLWEESRTINSSWQEVSLKQAPGKTLQLYIEDEDWIALSIPGNENYYLSSIPLYAYPGTLWFYIPEGKDYFYFRNEGGVNPDFTDPSGKPAKAVMMNKEGLYQIKTAGSNGWWHIDNAELKTLKFYLDPLAFFPHPDMNIQKVKQGQVPVKLNHK
jgi:hypothetical protein